MIIFGGMNNYHFQYCQKIVVFSADKDKVLLCQGKGEADYNGVYSFIGGKMETTDQSIIAGLKREKDEEVRSDFQIKIYPNFTTNILFQKKDGSSMILPHYLAIHVTGDVILNEEYSNFQWVNLADLAKFEPKIPSIPDVVAGLLKLDKIIAETDFVNI